MSNVTEDEKEEDMTLSQEILVLDFGDEKQSEFLKSELSSADFGRGKSKSSHMFNIELLFYFVLQIKLLQS